MALAATDLMLKLNGYELKAPEGDEYYHFIKNLAANNATIEEIEKWIIANSIKLSSDKHTRKKE